MVSTPRASIVIPAYNEGENIVRTLDEIETKVGHPHRVLVVYDLGAGNPGDVNGDDIVNAARLDGVSELGIVWRVMVPMATPAVTAFAIFSAVGHWNDLFWPLIVLTTHERRTLPVILSWYNSAQASRPHLTMTAAVLVVVPILVIYTIFQRWIVQGFTLSGFK